MSTMRTTWTARALLAVLTFAACSCGESPTGGSGEQHGAGSHFIAPSGSAQATGSSADPWDIATALGGAAGRVHPGDTLWLRGGTYSGTFTSTLSGTGPAPIVVRQYPGERATIDGSVDVNGRDTWYWGFEVANSNTGTQDVMGINSKCPGCRFINLVIHDHSGNGLGMWAEGPDQEAYGNIIFNNGFHGQSADHNAHGIYGQNRTGSQRILDNIIFNQFGYGVHIYGSDQAALNNYTIDGNTAFDNGLGSHLGMSGGMDYQVGGESPLQKLVFTDNNSYRTASLRGDNTARLGYDWGPLNYDGKVTDNYFVGQLLVVQWGSIDSARNVVIEAQAPSESRVLVQPNSYEPGRANIIVYNWSHQGSVAVDLSGILQHGQSYEVRDAEDFFGAPVASGSYAGGAIELPLDGSRVARSITGQSTAATGIEFAAFVVVPR
jgi:hypothetical protein